jgi:hypothetical protein
MYKDEKLERDIKIGDIYIEKEDNTESVVTAVTSNSVELFTKKKNTYLNSEKKSKGVDCKSWFSDRDLERFFVKKTEGKIVKDENKEKIVKQRIKTILKN